MSDFIIRESGLSDLEKIKEIAEATFFDTFACGNTEADIRKYLQDSFSLEQLTSEIRNPASHFYLAENDEMAIAYMKLNFDGAQTEDGHPGTLELQRIYVRNSYKNRHVGKMMIRKAIEIGTLHHLRYIWLGVWENNIAAIRFYEKHGFIQFDTHSFMLGSDLQTDYLMKCDLDLSCPHV